MESFRKRHQIVFNELCGESSNVNSETIEEWVAKLPSIIQGYGPENIANGDETGLFFRALPNKSLCLKGGNCMNEAAFSNCNAEDYINIDKDVQTEPDTMDIDALVQNFKESQKKREEEVEEEEDQNDIVLEEEK